MGEAGNSALSAPTPHTRESQTKNQPTALNLWSLKGPHALFQQFHSWHPPYRHHTTSEHQELRSLSFTFTGKRLEMTQVPNHMGPFNIPWGIHTVQCWIRACKMSSISAHQHDVVPGYIFEWRTQNYRVIIMECVLNIYVLFKGNIQTTLYTFLQVHLGACKNIKKDLNIYFSFSQRGGGQESRVWQTIALA